MPSRPTKVSPSTATIDGDHSKSGVVRAANASISRSLNARIACLAISTPSEDIAAQSSRLAQGADAGWGVGVLRLGLGGHLLPVGADLAHHALEAWLRRGVDVGHGGWGGRGDPGGPVPPSPRGP